MLREAPSTPADNPWTPYTPDKQEPWNLRRVVHLHRRAGFGATWSELQRDLKDGPKTAVDRILAGRSRTEGVPDGFAAFADRLARLAVDSGNLRRLQAWWMYRMLLGPDALGEKLALFWHNHFATSAHKVGMLVHGQNELFRKHGCGPFGELLRAVVRDPALLVWLDAPASRKEHPNENLARELMELFTLGIGHYTERDVKEAARALTGWTVERNRFRDDPDRHDAGEKLLLGQKGRWNGDKLLGFLLEHPATAERLATQLCREFLGEAPVSPAGIRALAEQLRRTNLDIGEAVATILRSRLFFADAVLGQQVLGPVGYVVGAARALEVFDPAPSTLVLAETVRGLGQDLFAPPNVGGWPGGRAWITSRAVIGRFNLAVALVSGVEVGLAAPLDLLALARKHGRGADLDDLLAFVAELLLGHVPPDDWRKRLFGALGPKPSLTPETARRIVALVLASPEMQLA
jgi:uncharacterized protein (DUF1800 family)